jgi:hypothetical protein
MHTQCNPDANGPKLPSRIHSDSVHDEGMAWNRCQRQWLARSVDLKGVPEAASG